MNKGQRLERFVSLEKRRSFSKLEARVGLLEQRLENLMKTSDCNFRILTEGINSAHEEIYQLKLIVRTLRKFVFHLCSISGRDEKWIKDQVRGEIGHLQRKIASGKVDTVPILRQVEGTRPLGSIGPEKD